MDGRREEREGGKEGWRDGWMERGREGRTDRTEGERKGGWNEGGMEGIKERRKGRGKGGIKRRGKKADRKEGMNEEEGEGGISYLHSCVSTKKIKQPRDNIASFRLYIKVGGFSTTSLLFSKLN